MKEIGTWIKPEEDFNKGTFFFILDLNTGSLWIYLESKQRLLNGQFLGAKEQWSFFQRGFKGNLTEAELNAVLLEVWG